MNPFFSFDDDEFFGDLLLMGAASSGGSVVQETATGNPLTFLTDLAKPLKSLLIPFTPQQEGTGDPSPSNIRSILPWDGLTVFGGGKNLLNPVAENSIPFQNSNYNKYTLTDGVVVTSGNTLFGFKAKVKPNTVYRFTFDTTEAITMEIFAYTEEPTVIKNDDKQIININSSTWQFTTFSDTEWISCGIYTSKANVTVKDFILTAGSAQEAYEPYHPITETDIVFPSPVYGGTLDVVSGVLTVEWTTKQFDGSSDENWYFVQVGTLSWYRAYIVISDAKQPNDVSALADSYKAVSFNNRSYSSKVCMFGNENELPIIFNVITELTTVESFRAYLAENPLTIAYKLATPQEIQLTPKQITALLGDNTIWSDADGSMTAVYLKKG